MTKTRSLLRAFSTVLIVSGALLLADAVATLLWEEPVSSIYARIEQSDLQGQLDRLEKVPPTPVERKALAKLPDPSRRLAFAARSLDRRTSNGDPLGKLTIDRIHLSTVFVKGTDAGDLRKGPGHYPATPLPGQRGTVGIAGHRTTYGAPFRRIDQVRPGDAIVLTMPYGRFTYRVERTRIVPPTAVWVTQRVSYDRLILSACHPLYSAAKRIVVFARLVRSQPRGAAA
ncbi:MAG TPA: class E sortase [Solirubrobacter sp.]|nr:class E sortase [Solirubrobacter sp.]